MSEQGAVDELGIGIIRDAFASLTAELSEKVSEKMAYMMKLACDFNNLVYMANIAGISSVL